MKTNVVLTRKMGEFDVLQRTSDGYFDGNALLHQWNNINSHPKKELKKFLDNSGTVNFLSALKREIAQSQKIDMDDSQVVVYKKGRNTNRGKTSDQVYMHPYLFIKFAMWLDPDYEVQVLKFVHDQLISNRHLAGDNYNKLTAQACKFTDVDYSQLGEALNWIVFNKHYRGIRNEASILQMQELHELEDKLAFLISTGVVGSFKDLVSIMRKLYSDKYRKF